MPNASSPHLSQTQAVHQFNLPTTKAFAIRDDRVSCCLQHLSSMRNSRFLAQKACLHAKLDLGRCGSASRHVMHFCSDPYAVAHHPDQATTRPNLANSIHMTEVSGTYECQQTECRRDTPNQQLEHFSKHNKKAMKLYYYGITSVFY